MAFPDQYSDSPVNDFTHLISTESMSDEENYIFLVEFKDEAKIISGYKDHASTVLSVSLQQGEFQKIVREATEKFKLMRNQFRRGAISSQDSRKIFLGHREFPERRGINDDAHRQ